MKNEMLIAHWEPDIEVTEIEIFLQCKTANKGTMKALKSSNYGKK